MSIQIDIYPAQQVREMFKTGVLKSRSQPPIDFLREEVSPEYIYRACVAILKEEPNLAVGFLLHTIRNGKVKIEFVFVDEERRNQRVATRMIFAMLDNPDNIHLHRLEMQSSTENGDRLISTVMHACSGRLEVQAKACPFAKRIDLATAR